MEISPADTVTFFNDKGHIASVHKGVIHVAMSSNTTANQLSISKKGLLQVNITSAQCTPTYIIIPYIRSYWSLRWLCGKGQGGLFLLFN